jgi:hypothetical protein
VHLLLGDPRDPCCRGVRDALEERDYPVRITTNPLIHPSRFTWQLDNERSASRLAWDDEPPLRNDQIAGVLVRNAGWIDPSGWQPDDLAYVQSETQAALLAWLWSLECPVVNRYPSMIWYQPRPPLLSWQRLLRRCGLPTLETLVTNVEGEARAFGRRPGGEGVSGAVYGPLTSDVRYLVVAEEDWDGLAAMQRYTPVSLSQPHGAAQSVCVVGERVVWEGEPSAEAATLEPALRRFAPAAGLAFVALALASTVDGFFVIDVEPHPRFERFGDAAQGQIVEGLVHLLTGEVAGNHQDDAQSLQGSLP